MNEEILKKVDHTLLKQTATMKDIEKICDGAIANNTASVCIPPVYVKQAKEYVKGKMKICTVIGFPNGYNTTSTKVFETAQAVKDGADEIDMVINIGKVKENNYEYISNEINKIKEECNGKLLKVIIETCLLTEDEILRIERPYVLVIQTGLYPIITKLPDISKWRFNKLFGMGNQDHNRKLREERESTREEREIKEMQLWC